MLKYIVLIIIVIPYTIGCMQEPTNDKRVLVILSTDEPIGKEPILTDTKTFRWIPTIEQVGEHNITFTATDSLGAKTVTGLKEFGLFTRDWLQPIPSFKIPTEDGVYDITYSLTSRYTIPASDDPNVLVIQVFPDPNSIINIEKVNDE